MADMAKVKEVRARTGVGFGDCKKALEQAGDDIEAAIDIIRKQSAVKAAKKADRTASEGLLELEVAANGKSAAIIEINIETDFAARNELFIEFCAEAVKQVLMEGEAVLPSLNDQKNDLVQTIGENISIRRAARYEVSSGLIGSYLHANNRLGALVELDQGDAELGKDIAMHVTAMNPMVVSSDLVPSQIVDREREIFIAQAIESGKPKEIAEKMVEGRLRKFLAESSLLDQPFVRDPQLKIHDLLEKHGASCSRFLRYELGEGIEKVEEDFASEVQKQIAEASNK
ncbi:MAG: translation elongation factor Ts [Pseudomonadales bacterium]|nr:translation elongation factor Ts [Pseudomonadales bacterium]HAO55846.1 elongation factor Ts [Gammaproteobacteria bacterium]|tara:strand:- start:2460 stop:3317 length:858 start_codon:yes stop_codon:yes gene_type:complete